MDTRYLMNYTHELWLVQIYSLISLLRLMGMSEEYTQGGVYPY